MFEFEISTRMKLTVHLPWTLWDVVDHRFFSYPDKWVDCTPNWEVKKHFHTFVALKVCNQSVLNEKMKIFSAGP